MQRQNRKPLEALSMTCGKKVPVMYPLQKNQAVMVTSTVTNAFDNTGWRTKCHTIDCTHNTFLFLQNHLTSGTELILKGWKIAPNESL